MSKILKLHSSSALAALRQDLSTTRHQASGNADTFETLGHLMVQLTPEPDEFPFAIEIVWPSMIQELSRAIVRAKAYGGDVVLYDDGEVISSKAERFDLSLSGYSLSDVATLLAALSCADGEAGLVDRSREDLFPSCDDHAMALIDLGRIPQIMADIREAAYIGHLPYRENATNRFFTWFDKQQAAMAPAVREFSKIHDIPLHHTGGGCLALQCGEPDGWFMMLTGAEDGVPESITEPSLAGFYHPDDSWWISTEVSLIDVVLIKQSMFALARALHEEGREEGHEDLKVHLNAAISRNLVIETERAAVDAICARD